jgi:polo-like kinase 1
VTDPSQRPTLDDILQHQFVKNHMSTSRKQEQGSIKRGNTSQTLQSPMTYGVAIPSLMDNAINLKGTEEMEKEPSVDKSIYEGNDLLAPVAIPRKNGNSVIQLHAVESKNLTSSAISLKSTGNINTSTKRGDPSSSGESGVHITKWMDYTSKYGMAYVLSDGTTGVVFNDTSKLTFAADENNFEYVQKKANQQREALATFNLAKYPPELQKKVTLLQYFKDYLEGKNDISIIEREIPMSTTKIAPTQKAPLNLIYVKSWTKTKHAAMFRLSNSLIQVEFTDKTQILLNSKLQMVYYKNKKGEFTQHKLASALDADYPEMVKRLKYTKQILVHWREAKAEEKKGQSQGQSQGQAKSTKEYEVDYNSITARDGFSEQIPHTSAYKGMARIKSYINNRH